jgi:hypothetical protein
MTLLGGMLILKKEVIMTIKSFEQEFSNSQGGKPGGFPRDIHFSFSGDGKSIRAEMAGNGKKDFRRLDPWTLACIVEAKQKINIEASNVVFVIDKSNNADKVNFESFRRRVSFLGINNPGMKFEILLNDEKVPLDDTKSLFQRPGNEIIHSKISKRSEDNKPNLLEKSFQSFLYGKGLKERTNDRLAILGEDFYRMKGKAVGVLREFPTGVFDGKITEATRIMPTEFVDFVTQNKWGNLAVIELKIDNSELEVISQILDYGLYFACYRNQIQKLRTITETFELKKQADIFCYVVNNRFHPRFDGILKFYRIKPKSYGFCLKKVILGETAEI